MDNLEDIILEKLNKHLKPLNAKLTLAIDDTIILSFFISSKDRYIIMWKTIQDVFFENYKKTCNLPIVFCQDSLLEYCKYFYLMKCNLLFTDEFILADIYSKLKFLENCCSLEEIAIKLDIHEI